MRGLLTRVPWLEVAFAAVFFAAAVTAVYALVGATP